MQPKSVLKVLLLGLVALQNMGIGAGYRILAAFFFPGKSHFMITDAIIRELVHRGHEVTFITPFSLTKENLGANYTEVLIPQYNIWGEIMDLTSAKSALDMTDISTITFLRVAYRMGLSSTNFAFEQKEVQSLITAKDKVGKYDLLLAEQFFNEGALILGHLYQIPIITVTTFGYSNYLSSLTGIINPWSYVAHGWKPYTNRMSLMERIDSVFCSFTEEIMRYFWYYPTQNQILQTQLSRQFKDLPTIKQLERNISVILLNSYMPLEAPRPSAFNMIPVGGLHIKSDKPLPTNIKRFLDEAKDGAIYFSLGSQVRSADFPPEKIQMFLGVFSSLKQRVLWKFEDDKLPNLPPNVMVQKWMPQTDILNHPNVKVFISHGGLFGTQEAVHYGVPVLGMPIYADQYLNIKKGEAAGYALSVSYRTVTEKELRYSLTELLENPKYRDNMKRASLIFRDRPMSAMDTAIYWIDYVVKHRGAPHLVSEGVNLPWYKFYLLDIVGIALALILLPILGLLLLCPSFRSAKKPKTKSKQN
ncbi:PREDICTED: UDP-glucuronosyltransferase 2B15 isoform X2 [Drosophila arizonae]|uniref:UDP-glucuronosyltransferase n=1 Tax=Drosophila arizonae TaxID=7263 RepID=A0ABM1PHR3_DROAR|nr:PREDICTED: UDP-glucuronosyltransferase 2B15 isoform X1 [Drosophila arizonae]XP_017866750.1 PREDICTED: UDP-glucuronosyltransferase 2B15 isoform X2 [Drosophila arizonae]